MLPSSSADAPITLPDGRPSLEKCQPSLFGTMITSPARQGPASGPASAPPSMPPSPASAGPASPTGPASTPASSGEMMFFDPPLPWPHATATAIAATAAAATMYQRILGTLVDGDRARVVLARAESDQHAPGGAVAGDAHADVGNRGIGECHAEGLTLVVHGWVRHGPSGGVHDTADSRDAERPLHSRPQTAVDVQRQRGNLGACQAPGRVVEAVARRVDADEPVLERADPGGAIAQCRDGGHEVVVALARHHEVEFAARRVPLPDLIRPQVPSPRNPGGWSGTIPRPGFRLGLSAKEITAQRSDAELRRANRSAHPHVVADRVEVDAVVVVRSPGLAVRWAGTGRVVVIDFAAIDRRVRMLHDLAARTDAVAGRYVHRVRLTVGEAVVAAEPDQVLFLVPDQAVDRAKLLAALFLVRDHVRAAEDVVMDHRYAAGRERHAIRVAALVDCGVSPLRRPLPLIAEPRTLTTGLALVTDEDSPCRTARQRDHPRRIQAGIRVGRGALRNAHALRGLAIQPSIRMQPVGDAELLERPGELSGRIGAHEEQAFLAARHPEVPALVHRDVQDVLRTAVLRAVEVPVGGGREDDVLEGRPAVGRAGIRGPTVGSRIGRTSVAGVCGS